MKKASEPRRIRLQTHGSHKMLQTLNFAGPVHDEIILTMHGRHKIPRLQHFANVPTGSDGEPGVTGGCLLWSCGHSGGAKVASALVAQSVRTGFRRQMARLNT